MFIFSCILIVFVFGATYYVSRFTKIKKLNDFLKQLIFGVLFSLLLLYSITYGTFEYGANSFNVSDSIILASGVIFGPITGLICGIFGILSRYVLHIINNTDVYLRFSSISVHIAAIILVFFYHLCLKKNDKPNTVISLVFCIFIEILHVLVVPLFSKYDIEFTLLLMTKLFLPAAISNFIITCSILFLAVLFYYKSLSIALRVFLPDMWLLLLPDVVCHSSCLLFFCVICGVSAS